jgi:hypothetical protein
MTFPMFTFITNTSTDEARAICREAGSAITFTSWDEDEQATRVTVRQGDAQRVMSFFRSHRRWIDRVAAPSTTVAVSRPVSRAAACTIRPVRDRVM